VSRCFATGTKLNTSDLSHRLWSNTTQIVIGVFNTAEVITAVETKALDRNAEYLGVSTLQLMENAGRAVADLVSSRFKRGASITVFAGTGRNGGDGMVAARHLANRGYQVTVVVFGDPRLIRDESTRRNFDAISRMRETVSARIVADSSEASSVKCDVAVDALLGTGARGELREPVASAVRILNKMNCFRLAVDLPTGVDADTGRVAGEAVRANLTLTLHARKPGLVRARANVGELIVADIGIPREAWMYTGPGDVETALPPREPTAHKGDFGRVLVVGGSETFSGAPALAALAALRTGVDLVYVATPEATAHDIASFSPNLITLKLKGDYLRPSNLAEIRDHITAANCMIVGPGLGTEKETFEAARRIIRVAAKLRKRCLIDADGLKALGRITKPLGLSGVLTPHAGEFKAISGVVPNADLTKRARQATDLASRSECVVLLKGRVDVVAGKTRVKLNWTGNPGMTVGGTGDVLSGVVAGLMAQGVEPFQAASAGAFINGRAGDLAAKEYGHHIAPTDLLPIIPHVLNDPMGSGSGN
jgi:NAD(P)H-hydrate epimerase